MEKLLDIKKLLSSFMIKSIKFSVCIHTLTHTHTHRFICRTTLVLLFFAFSFCFLFSPFRVFVVSCAVYVVCSKETFLGKFEANWTDWFHLSDLIKSQPIDRIEWMNECIQCFYAFVCVVIYNTIRYEIHFRSGIVYSFSYSKGMFRFCPSYGLHFIEYFPSGKE